MLLTIPVLVAQVFLRFWTPDLMTPTQEIVLMSVYKGVNPHLALAVAQTETGNVPEADGRRDAVVSLGNYGRFQVNCTTWQRPLGLDSCDRLKDRHVNIRAGLTILSHVAANHRARLSGPHRWVAHYNEGVVVQKGGRGERYARRVQFHMRRGLQESRRAFEAFLGW